MWKRGSTLAAPGDAEGPAPAKSCRKESWGAARCWLMLVCAPPQAGVRLLGVKAAAVEGVPIYHLLGTHRQTLPAPASTIS